MVAWKTLLTPEMDTGRSDNCSRVSAFSYTELKYKDFNNTIEFVRIILVLSGRGSTPREQSS